MEPLTKKDFVTHIAYVRDDIKGINERLDTLNGRTRQNERDIAVLKDRSAEHRRLSRSTGMKSGAIVGGIVTVLTALIEHFITK